jgi:hypothetical protein
MRASGNFSLLKAIISLIDEIGACDVEPRFGRSGDFLDIFGQSAT